jgi:hypothetical protein
MKKNENLKKIALRSETVRALETSKLAQAAGGEGKISEGVGCYTITRLFSCVGACSSEHLC